MHVLKCVWNWQGSSENTRIHVLSAIWIQHLLKRPHWEPWFVAWSWRQRFQSGRCHMYRLPARRWQFLQIPLSNNDFLLIINVVAAGIFRRKPTFMARITSWQSYTVGGVMSATSRFSKSPSVSPFRSFSSVCVANTEVYSGSVHWSTTMQIRSVPT